jgi:hypothetical protein
MTAASSSLLCRSPLTITRESNRSKSSAVLSRRARSLGEGVPSRHLVAQNNPTSACPEVISQARADEQEVSEKEYTSSVAAE